MVIFVYFAVIALAFFLLIVLPQRRRTTAHRLLLGSLQIGDEVITIGGILGTIRDLTDEKIELEVAPGVVITVARNAIAQMAQPASDPTTEALDDGRVDDGEAGE
jgi:preprotein translocase subunit YajC